MRRKVLSSCLAFFLAFTIVITSSLNVEAKSTYQIWVNYTENVVLIYENGTHIKSFLCSTGSATPRSGTYHMSTKYRWGLLKGGVWGQYCTVITGSIWFHSVPYCSKDPSDLEYWEYDKLGTACSAGCVRLAVQDVKWIYDNCPSGTSVTFYSGSDIGNLPKPTGMKISDAPSNYRGWDPTDDNSSNPWISDTTYTRFTFDADQYLKYNPDLLDSVGTDPLRLKLHWITTGIREKRQASDDFDLNFYLNLYPDSLSKYGDYYSCISFYNTSGKSAGQVGNYNNPGFKYVFDAKYYADTYPDVKNVYGYDEYSLWKHYINNGVYEKRSGSAVFSYDYCYNSYPELRNSFKDNPYLYFNYFLEQGIPQGMQAISNFDPMSYWREYSDLRIYYGNNMPAFYAHYMNAGCNEGRHGTGCTEIVGAATLYNGVDYSLVYDYNYYINHYPALKTMFPDNDVAVLEYFVETGMSHGDQAISTFDPKSYWREYSDLRIYYGNNMPAYYAHYMNSGYKEGRHGTGCSEIVGAATIYNGVDYSLVYDYSYYVNHYPALKTMFPDDDVAVLKYFVETGMSHGDQAISTFNPKSYWREYSDLRIYYGTNMPLFYSHYMNSGYNEGRHGTGCTEIVGAATLYNGVDYSLVYDYSYYINHYPALKTMFPDDDVAVLKYFVETGMSHGDQAISSFNPKSYWREYSDLRIYYGNNMPLYYTHYMNAGYYEGRHGTGCTEMVGAATLYNGVDYSSVYNYNYYINNYPALKTMFPDDDVGVLKYFVETGMSHGDQAISTFNPKSYSQEHPELESSYGDNWSEYYIYYMDAA